MTRRTIIGMKEFHTFLRTRFKNQMDGQGSAEEFYEDFLKEDMEHPGWWDDDDPLVLDFYGVETLSPTWCNEFVWRMVEGNDTVTEKRFRDRVKFKNMSEVKRGTMDNEIRQVFLPITQTFWRKTVREEKDV